MSAMKSAMRFLKKIGVAGYRSYGSGKQGAGGQSAAQGPLSDRKDALEGEYFYKKNLEDVKKMKEKTSQIKSNEKKDK